MAQGCNFSSSFFIFSINFCSTLFPPLTERKRRVFCGASLNVTSRLCEWNFMAHLLKSWLKHINLSFCRSLEWFTNTRKCQIMDDSKSCVRYLFTPPKKSASFSIFTDSSRSVYTENVDILSLPLQWLRSSLPLFIVKTMLRKSANVSTRSIFCLKQLRDVSRHSIEF